MRRENSSYACLLDVAILAKMSKVGPDSILCPDGDAWYKPKSQSQHLPTALTVTSHFSPRKCDEYFGNAAFHSEAAAHLRPEPCGLG